MNTLEKVCQSCHKKDVTDFRTCRFCHASYKSKVNTGESVFYKLAPIAQLPVAALVIFVLLAMIGAIPSIVNWNPLDSETPFDTRRLVIHPLHKGDIKPQVYFVYVPHCYHSNPFMPIARKIALNYGPYCDFTFIDVNQGDNIDFAHNRLEVPQCPCTVVFDRYGRKKVVDGVLSENEVRKLLDAVI